MKKILILFAALTLGLTQLQAQSPVKRWGQLQVKGTQLCAADGNPVQLRGVSFGWHNMWPRFYNRHAVSWLVKDWHVSVVRAAMGIQIACNYLERPQWSEQTIQAVVDAAIREGIYVVIDWHAHQMHQKEAAEFFGRMAEKYGKYPNVIYEIYNEPVDHSWEELKLYAAECIQAIRRHDPDNIVLVGCPHWDQDIHLVADSPLRGFTNIMYTVHFYAGTHGAELRERTLDALRRGVPIFISECGSSEASGDGKLDVDSWNTWIQTLEAHRLSWIKWSISDKFETCSMLYPMASPYGKWKPSDLSPGGTLGRETLRRYNR